MASRFTPEQRQTVAFFNMRVQPERRMTPHEAASEILAMYDELPFDDQQWFCKYLRQFRQQFTRDCEAEERRIEQQRCTAISNAYTLARHTLNKRR